MIPFTLKLSKYAEKTINSSIKRAEANGDLEKAKKLLTIKLFSVGKTTVQIAEILQVSTQSIRNWLKLYILKGIRGLKNGKSPGRPPKLTKTQKKQLSKLIISGPEKSGFPGSCWRTPMIQHLIHELFGVFYNVRYLSELLKNMGFSYQKATFVAHKRDEKARKEWLNQKWPEIMALAKSKNAHVLFGDEASFPQWGSLTYTWGLRGKQPEVPTSGTRKSFKVFGLIDYFTGRFFSKGHKGKLNSDSYIKFLSSVLSKTRKHIILIQDGASYHKGKKMQEFFEKHKNRITVFGLPSYSPDFNPIEKLWKKIKEKGIHLKFFPTFEELEKKVNEMLDIFDDAQNEVLPLFGFYNNLNLAS